MATSVPLQTTTDEELAEIVARASSPVGDRAVASAAYLQLYDRHQGKIRTFLFARVHANDVDDVEQEVWQRVWRFLPTKFQGGNFRAWLYQMTRNYLIDNSRRQKNVVPPGAEGEDEVDSRTRRPEECVLAAERAEALRSCLERLHSADAQAAALVRGRLAGKRYEELCPALGLDQNRAYEVYKRVSGQLKTCVQKALL